jgi:acyl-coenzyme A synthetase/AMP-(fatty) acid ligase
VPIRANKNKQIQAILLGFTCFCLNLFEHRSDRVETRSFAALSQESSRLAVGLRALGAKRGDRLLMMLGVCPELWATMLAAMKLGLVLIPAMPQLGAADIADRLVRGKAKYLVAHGHDAPEIHRAHREG